MKDRENLVRRTAFARQEGVVPETVDRWVNEGKFGLRKVKVGHRAYIDISDFDPLKDDSPAASTELSEADQGRRI